MSMELIDKDKIKYLSIPIAPVSKECLGFLSKHSEVDISLILKGVADD